MILEEIKKQKVKFSVSEQTEWLEYYEMVKKRATELQNENAKIENEIDLMVYELYGVNQDEVNII